MITITTKNIFAPAEPNMSTVLVHGTNCHGVMGAGIALAVKNLYPGAYDAYKEAETRGGLRLGEFSSYLTDPGFWIINLQTQDGTGGVRACSYDAIDVGFRALARSLNNDKFTVRFPLIGCGLGGGDWKIVGPLIDAALPDDRFIKQLHILNMDQLPDMGQVEYKYDAWLNSNGEEYRPNSQ